MLIGGLGKMKTLFSVLVALTFSLAIVAGSPAETKAAPAKPPEPAKKTEAGKEKSHQFTGIVDSVDAAAGTLMVRGKKESLRLKVSDEVSLEKIQVGDKVFVKYTGDTASSVKKVSGKKAEPEPKSVAPSPAPAEKK